jgi:hypothetical protein
MGVTQHYWRSMAGQMQDDDRDPELDPDTEPFWHHVSRLIGQVVIVLALMLLLVMVRRGH